MNIFDDFDFTSTADDEGGIVACIAEFKFASDPIENADNQRGERTTFVVVAQSLVDAFHHFRWTA